MRIKVLKFLDFYAAEEQDNKEGNQGYRHNPSKRRTIEDIALII